jgi:hypothetical protein
MGTVKLTEEEKELAASLFIDKPKPHGAGARTLMRAMRKHVIDDPSSLVGIVETMFRVAQDDKHPQMSTVQRMLLDRLDGPVAQQVKVAWESATEGITLHLPTKQPPRTIEARPVLPSTGTEED